MTKLGWLMVGIVCLHAGCGDDDNGDDGGIRIDAAVIDARVIDGPGGAAFDVVLTRAAEVPVCASAGAAATGATNIVITPDESMVIVDNLAFTGLSGPAAGAHIHSGAPGVAGPIVLDFGTDLTPPIDRTFTAADYPSPPPQGAPATFGAFIREMEAGNTYVNVHTAACPAGEIRGQLQ